MTVSQLIYALQQLDRTKEILGKFSGTWHEIGLNIQPCPDWPEYYVQVEVGSPKSNEDH